MAVLLALAAASANAWATVLQRLGVQNAPEESRMTLGLLTYALRRGVWLAGLACIGLGFLLQAVALRFGQLTSVQPIVTTELLFLVLILGVWFRYRLTWREWLGAAGAAGGLATFLAVAAPGGGNAIPSIGSWVDVWVVIAALVVITSAFGFTGPRWFRAAMFGTGGALLFALSAALTKEFDTLVTEGWGHVFTHWTPYALVATGVIGLFLAQNAFHAGPITASQAALTIVDPLASVVIGVWLFHDHLQATPGRIVIESLAMLVMFGGLFLLSQSPLVAEAKDDTAEGDKLVRQRRPAHPDGGEGRSGSGAHEASEGAVDRRVTEGVPDAEQA